jgi:hypothetical protein
MLYCNTREISLSNHTNQRLMNQPEQVFHICQYTETQGHQVIYHLVGSQYEADDCCDDLNSALADRGIPGSVASWYSTGPHLTAPHTN